jgi:urease accessory protein
MIIREKRGTLKDLKQAGRVVDWLQLEWYETSKRILHKRTLAGVELTLKFLAEAPNLQQNDVLYADEKTIIAIAILPCEVIVIQPGSMHQMAAACYEIGNKHLPLFYEDDLLLIPYEAPLFRLLQAAGFTIRKEEKQLLQPLKTSVVAHEHRSSESLFSKILKLTTDAS